MADKATTHCDLLHPSKYLRGADLLGRDVTVTIDSVKKEEVTLVGGKKEIRPILRCAGKEKGIVLNKTNTRIIKSLYGPYTVDWVGKSITIFNDPTVKFGTEVTGGLRVRPKVPRTTDSRPGAEAATNRGATPPPDEGPTGDGPPPDDLELGGAA